MNTNSEETIFLSEYLEELKKTDKKIDIKSAWKPVSIGGVSAIMLGVGAYAIGNMGSELFHVDDDKSFDEAFDEARQEIGSDGVFQYKDGVYVACSPEEWDEKSETEKTSVVAHLVPEDYLDVDLSTPESHESRTEQVVTVDVNENVKPLEVEVVTPNVDENVAFVVEEHAEIIEPVNQDTDETDVVMVPDNVEEDQSLTDEIEVTLVNEPTIEHTDRGVVGKIIEEIADLFVAESSTSHPAPLEASKAVNVDEAETSDNPEVAPDMPDYMQDADVSSIF